MRHSWSAKSTVLTLLAVLCSVACSTNSNTAPTLDSGGNADAEVPRDTVPGIDTLPDVLPDLAPVDIAEEDHKADVVEETFPPDLCVPDCADKKCGDDGCGGSCGECEEGQYCFLGACKDSVHLTDTGQETCYDAAGAIIPCPSPGSPFHGQDASYRSVEMSFTDNGDGTITDLSTGLTWAKCSAGQTGGDCSGAGFVGTQEEAAAHCADNVDGLSGEGWRLPTRVELLTLTSFDAPPCTPALFSTIISNYWTSTASCTVATMTCTSGYCGGAPDGFQGRARCVRGTPLEVGSFVDNADGTVNDLSTGLVWQKADDATKRTWLSALAYCESLDLAGWSDWRLPNAKELPTIADMAAPNLSIDGEIFPEPGEEGYWTGTTMPVEGLIGTALATHSNGAMGLEQDTKDTEFYVRCVRSTEDPPCGVDCGGRECGPDGCGGSCGECLGMCYEGICSQYVTIPAGDFTMGTPASEACRGSDEVEHQVSISHPFLMKATEVTQAEWIEVMEDANPAFFKNCGPDCPVEMVSWFDAVYYCNKLSQQEGLEPCYELLGDGVIWTDGILCEGYRLATEAEWEWAARGGTSTPLYNGVLTECNCGADPVLNQIGWACGNSAVEYAGCAAATDLGGPECAGTHPVALKAPNDYGLYDMAGNCYEWAWDWYGPYSTGGLVVDPMGPQEGVERVMRGGCWAHQNSNVRSGNRSDYDPSSTAAAVGFRPVRSILGDE